MSRQVLLSFIITAGLSLLISSTIILSESKKSTEAKVLRKMLLSFSDQQIITGIGIQVCLFPYNITVVSMGMRVWELSCEL